MSQNQESKKLHIMLLFGGKSSEHEVSLLSAKSVYEVLDKDKYFVSLVGIDKQGHWRFGEASKLLLNTHDPKRISLNEEADEVQTTVKGDKAFLADVATQDPLYPIDVVLPIMHGAYGEDGSIQGFLELLNVAYVGASVLGSAIGMDKDVMKRLLNVAGIKTAQFVTLRATDVLNDTTYAYVINTLKLPVFIKPANSGSSVGITKANTKDELAQGIATAFKYDTKVLIEQYIQGREIEVSVLGNENPKASLPGEIITQNHEFYDYEAKYLDEHGAILQIPAQLEESQIQAIQHCVLQAYAALECSGLARVDCFLTKTNEIYINEINTMPGFTKSSMYPKLWEASGVSYTHLLDTLINLALEKQVLKDKLERTFTA